MGLASAVVVARAGIPETAARGLVAAALEAMGLVVAAAAVVVATAVARHLVVAAAALVCSEPAVMARAGPLVHQMGRVEQADLAACHHHHP